MTLTVPFFLTNLGGVLKELLKAENKGVMFLKFTVYMLNE